jgi:HlyD family secretion protein
LLSRHFSCITCLVFVDFMEKLPEITPKRRLPMAAIVAAIVLGVGGIGTYAFTNLRSGNNLDQTTLEKLTIKAETQDVTLKIAANGSVLPGQTVNLSPKSSGRVAAVFVEQGDLVKQGQKIAQMENADIRAQLLQSQANLRSAQANLSKSQNGTRPEEITQAKARVDSAQASFDKSQNGNRPEEIAQARAKVERAKADLQLSQSNAPQDLSQAKTQETAAKAKQNLAQIKLKRFQQLFRDGAVSRDRLDEATADYQTNTASLSEAQQKVRQVASKAQQDIAQRQASLAEAEQNLKQQLAGSRKEDTAKLAADLRQSQSAYDQSKKGSRSEEIAQLKAAVEAAEAQVLSSQVQMRESVIVAPFDGIITQRYASVGAFVTPTTTASKEGQATSTSVVAIARDLEVKVKVPEVDIGKVLVGQKVEVGADAYPDGKFLGTVRIVAPEAVVEQNVTAFEVRVSIDNDPTQKLKSGMNVNVSFVGKSAPAALMVPTVAIVRNKGKDGVLIPGKDNQPEFREIELGFSVRDKTQILKGIQSGDRVFIDTPKGFKLNKDKEK